MKDLTTFPTEFPTEIPNEISARGHRLNQEELMFILSGVVTIGVVRDIVKEFKVKFGKSITTTAVYIIKNNPKFTSYIERFRNEFDQLLSREYLTSPRKRIIELTKIYEKAMDNDDLRLASDQIMRVNEILYGKHSSGDTTINLFQNNQYNNLTLEEIRTEQSNVLKKLEHVRMELDELDEKKKEEL